MFAVVDIGYLKLAWVQAVDRHSSERIEHHKQGPALRMRIADGLADGKTYLHGRGMKIDIHNHLDGEKHAVSIKARSRGLDTIKATLTCHHPRGIDPLVVCIPFGDNRALYSHKSVLPVSGNVTVGDRTYVVDGNAHAIIDIHKGHYPRYSWWNWATFVGRDAAGRLVAANFTRNVAGDEVHENALWIDGKLERLAPSVFALNGEPWTLKTLDDRSRLRFSGIGERTEDLNLGLVVSSFRQRFGNFSGTLGASEGKVEIANAFGLFEDHSATW
jgi:hypothetical protein